MALVAYPSNPAMASPPPPSRLERARAGLARARARASAGYRRAKGGLSTPSLKDLAGIWVASGATAVAMGFVTSTFGPEVVIGDKHFPVDISLGVLTGVVGTQMRSQPLVIASAFIMGASMGRIAHGWFHGPPTSSPQAKAKLAAAQMHGYAYGFGGDPLVEAARYL